MSVNGQLSRPPLVRMLDIHELLQRGQKANRRTLALSLEVSPKTVQRDIDFMRDRLGLPIEYDGSTHSYSYTRRVVQFPTMQISEGELVALAVATKALAQYQSTPFEKPLRDALTKLSSSLRDQNHFAWEDRAGDAISFRASGQSAGDLGLIDVISQCVRRKEEIEFAYRKLRGGEAEARVVRPLHLACIEQQWYLFGDDLQRTGSVRTFAVTRMDRLVCTGRNFQRAEPFSLDVHLASSFGVFSSAKPERIVLRFDRLGGQLVQERTWHASQQIEPLPEGGVRLTMQVGAGPEIARWILGWGEHVEVLAPAALRTEIAGKSAQVAAIYGGDGQGG